jgi:hypothetical protein
MTDKRDRLPPLCDIEYLGVLPIAECRRLMDLGVVDGVFYVYTPVGYSIEVYSGKGKRYTKGYAYKYTPKEDTRA